MRESADVDSRIYLKRERGFIMIGILKKQIAVVITWVLVLTIAFDGAQMDAASKSNVNRKKITLTVGSTAKLSIRNTKKKVIWRSSNRKVATVSAKGVVRAKKKGTARITAKIGKKKLVCRVTVVANKQNGSGAGGTSPDTKEPTQNNQNTTKQFQQEVLRLVNKERAAEGLAAMVLDETLCNAAMVRAEEITKVFSHTRPDGRDCFSIFKELGIQYRAVGENIAAGQQTPASVMDSWMNSQGHRENIMSKEFNKLGVGYVKTTSGYGSYWVQVFSN